MSGGTNQSTIRKAIGALKDRTTVSLAKVHSDYKELDINLVKATNHVERPAKEQHIKTVFAFISGIRPRADIAYCIHALSRRLAKTHNWAVALKTLILIHRALREVDPTFQEELMNYSRCKRHMLNMANFKDDSSPNAWDYSVWVRNYALFLEERLECMRVLKYDVESEFPKTRDLDTPELLDHLPALQQLLFRIIGCQPQGAGFQNNVIKLALSLVASESTRVHNAIKDGTKNLVDKYFEMKRHDAHKALDIYRRAVKQAERLSEFNELCTILDIARGEKFPKIEQPPVAVLPSMEEYVGEAPRSTIVHKDLALDAPKEIVAIEHEKHQEVQEKRPPSPSPPPPKPKPVKVEAPVQPPDLLCLDGPSPAFSASDQKNASALAIVPVDKQSTTTKPDLANITTGWELALVTALDSNESSSASSKLAGDRDKLTLDSLYNDAIRRSNQNVSYNTWEQTSLANPMMTQTTYDPFHASNALAAASTVQMAAMANQQQAYMLQQQQMMMMMNPQQQPFNSFGNPYCPAAHPYCSGMPVQAYNAYKSLI
ncbi:Phosphoinositide-binding clathrin adaptor [Heracleum sosnowskyi]|uniref:Phosphoinositide-binding clathrin adaptor n=1 Tax=Heracleum sosnowskyi TaxID=360622 RepID=A0AAD8JIY6_9APIA|nr:Phosphoinositide-binding clathrin adaptor [Heracleum sosnowskyi]